jgi:sugar lactone lactonase YvrE
MRQRRQFFWLAATTLSVVASAVASRADVLVVDHNGNDIVNLYNDNGTPVDAGDPTMISLPFATGVAVGPDGAVYVDTADPQTVAPSSELASVFKYTYNSSTGDVTSSSPFVQYDGTPASVFNPQGMKFGPNGDLYIADLGGNGVVHLFDPTGNSVTTLLPAGTPTAVAFGPNGNLYAATSAGAEEYDSTTQSFNTIVIAATGGPNNPGDLAFGPDGKLYVLDISSADPQIFQYNSDGSDQQLFGSLPADFQPSNLAFGPDGSLYVSGMDLDTAQGEVLKANSTGTQYSVFISGLSNPGFLAFTDVPEPATLGLLAAGSLLFVRRRSR